MGMRTETERPMAMAMATLTGMATLMGMETPMAMATLTATD